MQARYAPTLSTFCTVIQSGMRKPEARAAVIFSTTESQRVRLYASTWFTGFPASRRFAE